MHSFTPRTLLWLMVGLAFVVAPIICFVAHDLGTGLLVSVSIAAMLFLGFSNLGVMLSTWIIVAVAFALELATQERFWILEMIILMFGGFLMTFVGGQIRKALDRAEMEQGFSQRGLP